jgi:hypothetical protein
VGDFSGVYSRFMSVPVDLDKLSDALADFTFGYLITVGDDFRSHTVAVEPVLADGHFRVGAVGRSTARNVAAHPDVTVVWPPRVPGGYSLIVDGVGALGDSALTIAPGSAVLHRPAVPNTPTAAGCGDDCVPLG